MDGNNWASIIVGLIGLAGIAIQAYFANRTKQDKNIQTKELKEAINRNSTKIDKLTAKLSANDMATVSSLRQNIRHMYYELLPYKMISVVDLRALDEMYQAYKGVTLPDGHHPNSWCDALYAEMSGWEKVEVYPNRIKEKKGVK